MVEIITFALSKMHVLKQIDTVKQWLEESVSVLVTSHHNPDGDAIGSALAMYLALKGRYNVKCAVPNDYPDFLKWLPGSEEIINYEKSGSKDLFEDADVIFCLDYNAINRTGSM